MTIDLSFAQWLQNNFDVLVERINEFKSDGTSNNESAQAVEAKKNLESRISGRDGKESIPDGSKRVEQYREGLPVRRISFAERLFDETGYRRSEAYKKRYTRSPNISSKDK